MVHDELGEVDRRVDGRHGGRGPARRALADLLDQGGQPLARVGVGRPAAPGPAAAAERCPAATSGRVSRTTRCAARSRTVQPSHSVGASGPAASMVSQRASRSARTGVMAAILAAGSPARDRAAAATGPGGGRRAPAARPALVPGRRCRCGVAPLVRCLTPPRSARGSASWAAGSATSRAPSPSPSSAPPSSAPRSPAAAGSSARSPTACSCPPSRPARCRRAAGVGRHRRDGPGRRAHRGRRHRPPRLRDRHAVPAAGPLPPLGEPAVPAPAAGLAPPPPDRAAAEQRQRRRRGRVRRSSRRCRSASASRSCSSSPGCRCSPPTPSWPPSPSSSCRCSWWPTASTSGPCRRG